MNHHKKGLKNSLFGLLKKKKSIDLIHKSCIFCFFFFLCVQMFSLNCKENNRILSCWKLWPEFEIASNKLVYKTKRSNIFHIAKNSAKKVVLILSFKSTLLNFKTAATSNRKNIKKRSYMYPRYCRVQSTTSPSNSWGRTL